MMNKSASMALPALSAGYSLMRDRERRAATILAICPSGMRHEETGKRKTLVRAPL
jgi:hypothetical protein